MGERLYSTGAFARSFQSEWQPQIALLRGLMEDIRDEVSGWDDVFTYDAEVEEIEVDHRSGFIPTTQGGFDLCLCAELGMGHGSGAAPKAVQPYIESSLKDAGTDWLRDHGEEFGHDPDADYGDDKAGGRAWGFILWLEDQETPPEGQGTLPMHLPRRGTSLAERARESLYEYEDEALRGDGATYFYKARAILYHPSSHHNETGEPEVYLIAGINTDFGYGRDSIPWLTAYGADPQQTRWTGDRTIKLADLTEELVEQLRRDIIKGLADA